MLTLLNNALCLLIDADKMKDNTQIIFQKYIHTWFTKEDHGSQADVTSNFTIQRRGKKKSASESNSSAIIYSFIQNWRRYSKSSMLALMVFSTIAGISSSSALLVFSYCPNPVLFCTSLIEKKRQNGWISCCSSPFFNIERNSQTYSCHPVHLSNCLTVDGCHSSMSGVKSKSIASQ